MSRIRTSMQEIRQLDPLHRLTIPRDYLDENNHVNVQYYLHLVERGLTKLFEGVGLGQVYASADTYGNFALEQHIRYFTEILADDCVSIHIRLLELSRKRAYFMGFLVNDTRDNLAAAVEVVMMNVDMAARRGAPFPADAYVQLEALLHEHKRLTWPAPVCGVMSA